MAGENKNCCCEDCAKIDETNAPADCLAGHGKVAFYHRACADFIVKPEEAREDES
jgi:hypothetical protein